MASKSWHLTRKMTVPTPVTYVCINLYSFIVGQNQKKTPGESTAL